jgi:hypothetical protein
MYYNLGQIPKSTPVPQRASMWVACSTRPDETESRRCDQVLPIVKSVLQHMLHVLAIEEMFAEVNTISHATHCCDA